MIIAAILICASVSVAIAQERSEDRDKPAVLQSNKVNDDLDGSDTQYFYKFTAGPGKLTVTFEGKASGTNAGAMLDLFDNSKPILSDVLAQGIDGGSDRQSNSVQINGKRVIVMRILIVRVSNSIRESWLDHLDKFRVVKGLNPGSHRDISRERHVDAD